MTTTSWRLASANTISTAQSGTSTNQPTMRLIIETALAAPDRAYRLIRSRISLPALNCGHVFLADIDLLAGAWIAADAGRPVLHREGAEAAQLDPVATRHGVADLIEDGVDDVLDITLEQMRILVGKFLHELRLDHTAPRRSSTSRVGPHIDGPACQSETSPSSAIGPSAPSTECLRAALWPSQRLTCRTSPRSGSGK